MNKSNHLINETSPYLLQHAKNPVEWYPWGEKALEKARHEKKPILLSIGYTACHWCHVMAHESFEDAETAEVMNKLFVNIKVDREERPDIDKVYQTAHYLLTQTSGGWPLTVFLAPDNLVPFFSGTYFPKDSRQQLPTFKEVLNTIAAIYQKHPLEIHQQNQELLKILQHEAFHKQHNIELNAEPINQALQVLQLNYDKINGGFGGAPKFPHPTKLAFLIKMKSSLANTTLKKMSEGGIYDQLAGGFFRYAVDASWRIPHFEKMLYDNAQLLYLYAIAYSEFHEPSFAVTAKEISRWLLNKMRSPEGGFYASLDADSEGHEGKYYIWNKFEISSLLTPEEQNLIRILFGIDKEPNFEKHWHLYMTNSLESTAQTLNLSITQAAHLLNSAKVKLLNQREKRISPECDTKILTAWNALMIKALIVAGDSLSSNELIQAANETLNFIQQKLWINHQLYSCYKNHQAKLPGYLDDYAFLLDAIMTKLQSAWDSNACQFAIELADSLLKHFESQTGGFYFTANNHEKLPQRPMVMMDEATPAGNGIAAHSLLKLGYLLGETRYINAALNTLQAAFTSISQFPAEYASLLFALQDFLDPTYHIVIRGPESEGQIWHQYGKQQTKHNIYFISDASDNLPESLKQFPTKNKVYATICQGTHCIKSIDDLEDFKKILDI